MSESMKHIFECDNCHKVEDIGYKSGLPRDWSRIKYETTDGVCIYEKVDICNDCGYDKGFHSTPRNKEKNKNMMLKFLSKVKFIKWWTNAK